MNRRILFLSVALLGLAACLAWLLREKWREARANEQAVLSQQPHVRAAQPPLTPAPVPAASPADYIDVAQKTLFSKDRNPNVPIDPPPPPKPEPPMPALPTYWGQMSFGDPVVILTAAQAPEQKRYHTGDKVGDFKLVSFNSASITFDWNGKEVQRKLEELAPKDGQPQATIAAPAAPQPQPGQMTTILAPSAPQESTVPPTVGADMGAGFRACVKGDNSPAGTVVSGYKKVIAQGLMGPSCNWEQVK